MSGLIYHFKYVYLQAKFNIKMEEKNAPVAEPTKTLNFLEEIIEKDLAEGKF